MTEPKIEQKAHAVAWATRECDNQVPGSVGPDYHNGPDDGCHFTGRVLLFPEGTVRVKCGGCGGDKQVIQLQDFDAEPIVDCPVCGGSGYTVSADPQVWGEALMQAPCILRCAAIDRLIEPSPIGGAIEWWLMLPTEEKYAALVSALYEALKGDSSIKLGEVK